MAVNPIVAYFPERKRVVETNAGGYRVEYWIEAGGVLLVLSRHRPFARYCIEQVTALHKGRIILIDLWPEEWIFNI